MRRLDDICAVSVVYKPFVLIIPNAVNVDCAVFQDAYSSNASLSESLFEIIVLRQVFWSSLV